MGTNLKEIKFMVPKIPMNKLAGKRVQSNAWNDSS